MLDLVNSGLELYEMGTIGAHLPKSAVLHNNNKA